MMPALKITIILWSLIVFSSQNLCLNNNGNSVQWWVVFNTPSSIPNIKYLYFDSTFSQSNFSLHNIDGSSIESALGRTLTQINSKNLSVIAWNDQKPNGPSTSSSAHSKSLIAIDYSSNSGFIIDHSLPHYPAFRNNTINITINTSQTFYGQHIFCMSLQGNTIDTIVENIRTINPYVYYSNFVSAIPYPNIFALGNSIFKTSAQNFRYYSFSVNGSSFKTIYKNGNNSKNCSIFEDGLNNYLNSSLFAQTWGRPLDRPWCGTLAVNNVATVGVDPIFRWSQSRDHSKWVITQTGTWSCFGDMNRMKSQWKRGGVFYCLNNKPLHDALRNLITTDSC